jgi:hypothetical protein
MRETLRSATLAGLAILTVALVEHVRAGDARREQVGGELNPRKGEAEGSRDAPGGQRLPRPRDVLEGYVSTGEHAEEGGLEERSVGR